MDVGRSVDSDLSLAHAIGAGVAPSALDALVERARREVVGESANGVLPSCQIALVVDGDLVVRYTIGHTIGSEDQRSRYCVFSLTKAVTGALIWLLIGEGRLDPSTRVAEVLDGFGANGKSTITVAHLLTHTAGLPRAPMGPADWGDRVARLARMVSWRCNWEPGTACEYHPTSAHWVLAELAYAVTGEEPAMLIRRRLLDPLGLDNLELGVAADDPRPVREVRSVGSPPTSAELEAALGIPGLDLGEVTDDALVAFNRPEVREVGVPGAGAVSDAGDLARFMWALLDDRAGLFDPEVLAEGTERVRCDLVDPMLLVPAHRTLGLVLAGEGGARQRGFPEGAPRAFGCSGAGGQVAWADPDRRIAFCMLTDGLDANLLRLGRRVVGVGARALACVPSGTTGFGGSPPDS